jgi:hypothetical protein
VLGKERLVTAVSGVFEWLGGADAHVFYYDKTGKETGSETIGQVKQPDGCLKIVVPAGGMCAVE